MKPYLKFLKKLLIHKLYVIKFGLKLEAPLLNLIIHDWSKFLPCEHQFWFNRQINTNVHKYDFGWIHHYHVNKHHWQYWVLREDSGITRYLDIPDKYIKEMIADWAAAGLSKTGRLNIKEWYYEKKDFILISNKTRVEVEKLLEKYF